MRLTKVLITVLAALGAASCSSTRIQTDYDHQADFGSYSTFAWHSDLDPKRSPTEGPSQILDRRIRGAIAGALAGKGLQESGSTEADLEVAYYTSLSPQVRYHTTWWGPGWGWGPYWHFGYSYWPGWSTTTAQAFHEGTIVIDLIDREKNQLVWRGVTTRVLGAKSHTDEKIRQAMQQVFLGYPPLT